MDNEKFTVAQLKETLKQMGLLNKGNKPELLRRLCEYDPSGEWKQDARGISTDESMEET